MRPAFRDGLPRLVGAFLLSLVAHGLMGALLGAPAPSEPHHGRAARRPPQVTSLTLDDALISQAHPRSPYTTKGAASLPADTTLLASLERLPHPGRALVRPPTPSPTRRAAEPPRSWSRRPPPPTPTAARSPRSPPRAPQPSPLDMRHPSKGPASTPRPPAPRASAARPPRPWAPRPWAYRPRPGDIDLAPPSPAQASTPPQKTKRQAVDPPLAERILPPRPRRFLRPRAIFHLGRRGEPIYDGQEMRLRSDGRWHYRGPGGTFYASVGRDGDLAFRDKPSVGLTDALMRRLGQDPYAAEKLRFARTTGAWRVRLRRRWIRRRAAESLARYKQVGPVCRRYRRLDARGKAWLRQILFARWDETQEEGAGLRLRAALLRIARHCSMRYQPQELVRLNARRQSRARFSP